MKTVFKYLGVALVAVFIGMQFVRPTKNVSPAAAPGDFMALYPPPPAIRQVLSVACYDCHSNNTRYPWYAEIQPSAWWLQKHVEDGKNELNFSEFDAYSKRTKKQKMEAAADEVRDQAMPLPSYLWMHGDARLTPEQRKALTDWFEAVLEKIEDEG